MERIKKLLIIPALAGVLSPFVRGGRVEAPVPVLKAVEITAAGDRPDEAFLARPVALAVAAGEILVADAQDCAIKVYDPEGRFVRSIGRKGAGPGEFSFPSGVCASGETIWVADKFNLRIQALDRQGRPTGGFRLDFPPDKIHAVGQGRLLVTRNPGPGPGGGRMLRLYDAAGAPLWEGLESQASGDAVYDAFRNMVLVCPAGAEGFLVVRRSEERTVLHFGPDGALAGRIAVDDRHVFKPVRLPFPGPKKILLGFCWSAAFDRGRLYLLEPESVEGRDLGPGRRLSVLGREGRMEAVIDLPRRVHRFAVDGDRIYALDEEGELGIFEAVR